MRLFRPRCLASHHVLHQTSEGLSHTCCVRGDHAGVHHERLECSRTSVCDSSPAEEKRPKRLRLVCQLLLSLLFNGELAPHTKALRHNPCAILLTRTTQSTPTLALQGVLLPPQYTPSPPALMPELGSTFEQNCLALDSMFTGRHRRSASARCWPPHFRASNY